MIEHSVRLFSTVDPKTGQGGFQPSSFSEWIGHEVVVTSLDPGLRHVLRAVETTEDGAISTLTIQTYSDSDVNLSANLSIRPDTPKAQVRAHTEDGEHLVTSHLDAPLQLGQTVDISGAFYVVRDASWPYRDPEHPESTEDYQHVTLQPVEGMPDVQSLGMAHGILGLLG
jgi:hypothetical protein